MKEKSVSENIIKQEMKDILDEIEALGIEPKLVRLNNLKNALRFLEGKNICSEDKHDWKEWRPSVYWGWREYRRCRTCRHMEFRRISVGKDSTHG